MQQCSVLFFDEKRNFRDLTFNAGFCKFMTFRIYISGRQYYRPAGIGTLDFPGCQRVVEPVSRLFFINPSHKK
ncbi:hypothetical protein CLV48_101845 [Cecembia rubra]|uniref:Uncharacterized protein n=1 Tax=Cecembia rubra TaxID=1485585 RepID=A0A2P8EEK3_9BACT|nr:hypothetical protein CLV48_101845 [Cecembia rubra]